MCRNKSEFPQVTAGTAENGASSYKIKIRTTINPCEAPQVTTNSYSRNKNQTAAILVFGKAYNEETFYNNLTMNSQKIGVTTRSMSKGNEFLTSKPASESDKGVSLASGRSTSAMKHKPNETASEKLAVRSNKGESRPGSQTKSSSTRKSKSSTKTKSSGSGSTGSSSSSYSSAKAKKAVLLARLKSNNEIESLKQQQSKERFDFEEEQLKYKLLQREEELKQKRIQEEEELKQKRI